MHPVIEPGRKEAVKAAMEELGNRTIIINGVETNACSCYYYSLNPPHVLFNDNCPEMLKEEIRSIFRYFEIELPLANS